MRNFHHPPELDAPAYRRERKRTLQEELSARLAEHNPQ